jgi:hypothetical protein
MTDGLKRGRELLGRLNDSPPPPKFALVDESIIPPLERTGGGS